MSVFAEPAFVVVSEARFVLVSISDLAVISVDTQLRPSCAGVGSARRGGERANRAPVAQY